MKLDIRVRDVDIRCMQYMDIQFSSNPQLSLKSTIEFKLYNPVTKSSFTTNLITLTNHATRNY